MMTIFIAIVALSIIATITYKGALCLAPIKLKRFTKSRKLFAVFLALPVMLPSIAGAHGNVSLEDDVCVQRVGGNLVHFNAYQPQHAAKAQYCTDIPAEGDTFLVVDLVDPVLRNLPIGVRVIKGLTETAEAETVAYWAPAVHPDGVLRGETKFTKGHYRLVITPAGFSPSSYLLRVQQIDYANVARTAVGPLTVLLLLIVIGYEVSKSTRIRSWWVSSRA
jgi:hypothetical protein